MKINNVNICITNNPISYRSILTIPKNISFGLELELEDVSFEEVDRLVRNQFGGTWYVKDDKSLKRDNNAEIVTPPLFNIKQTWILIKKLGKLLQHLKPTFNNCSFQVNFDASLLSTYKEKLKFLKLFAVYEDIIYRFSKGTDKAYRESLEEYAYPIILSLKDYKRLQEECVERYTNTKRSGISFKTKPQDLVEFRTPNVTTDPIIMQNYITFFYYLMLYSKSPKCCEKELDEYINNFNKTYLLEYYEKPHEEKALDLSNKIFTKKDDQLYFLEQYNGLNR